MNHSLCDIPYLHGSRDENGRSVEESLPNPDVVLLAHCHITLIQCQQNVTDNWCCASAGQWGHGEGGEEVFWSKERWEGARKRVGKAGGKQDQSLQVGPYGFSIW